MVVITDNVYNFLYPATGYPAGYPVPSQPDIPPDIRAMKLAIKPDTGYQNRPEILYNPSFIIGTSKMCFSKN